MTQRTDLRRRRFIVASATIGLTTATSGCNGILSQFTGGSSGQSISIGEDDQGEISEGGPRDPVFEDLSALYTFSGSAGNEVRITMRSDAFDPYVVITRPDGTRVDQGDDGGSGLDTQFSMTLPADGEYHLWAQSYSGEATGTFTLRLEEAQAVVTDGWNGPPESARRISYGDEVEGTITDSSPRDPELNDLATPFTFEGSTGDSIRVNMRSEALDPLVVLSGPEGETVHEHDDGGEGFNTLFTVTLSSDGIHTIWAGSWSGTATGPFTLSLERA